MRWQLAALGLVACTLGAIAMPACGDDGSTGPLVFGDGGADGSNIDTDGQTFNADGGGVCMPKTCQQLGFTCGPNADGCGGILDCGQCTAPAYCGGSGFSQCGGMNGFAPDGAPACVPLTCQQLGFNCGPAGDGCGGLLQCGTCSGNDICGGGGKPSVCGNNVPCVGLCKQQVACDSGTTTISGRVVAGTLPKYGNPDPVPNVLVYVPNAALTPFTKGVTCSQCGADVSGSPLVQTTTAIDGKFSLTNVPVGNNIPVVIQLGRWRRTVTFNVNAACQTTAVGDIHMPRNKAEGDIPLTALSTGAVDGMECVLLKMGVDQAEFTVPNGGGRMELYMGNGADIGNGAPAESTLTGNQNTLNLYDQIFFPCWGNEIIKTVADQKRVIAYADGGGRVFATHFSYTWLFNISPWSGTAVWNVNAGQFNNVTGTIDNSFQKGKDFASWMGIINALSNANPPQFGVASPRHDFDSVTSPAARWVYSPNYPLHYTFDTPWGNKTQCGRVIFSDFHVTNANGQGFKFPAECDANPMTPQEKALEYMIWDLASCVPGPQPPKCTPTTCQAQNINCGPAGDGCGNLLQCGTCQSPQTCGGGGKYGQCGYPEGGSCVPATCQSLNVNCGPAGDGCGNLLQCGSCVLPATCGGGGTAGQCGTSGAN